MATEDKTDTRPKFIPNTKRSFWNSRFWYSVSYYVRQLRHGTAPKLFTAATLYVVGYNILVRKWKGEGHPVNRYQWRIMERRGELSDELLRKKRVVNEYFHARLTGK
ncbi:hypothetical protein Tcan_12373 [Toxocara canis]|uniref:Uncharacterized protein n=1 Tax=Toxocara canis TaxID=6265 RepID=A0A0B2VWR3_TOXCA|nr:hypothetical protein Tcan_12373 [Toxocara canis]